MKLGATIGLRDDPDKLATLARRLEDAGVDHLWTGEAYTADAVSTMGFLAAVTTRATLGSAILPLYSRTPTLLGMTAVGLDRLSRGRFVLGIGASGPQVIEGFHGVPYDQPLQRTREIIEVVRAVVHQEKLVHAGRCYQIPLPPGQGTGLGKALRIGDPPVRTDVPIYVASLGPKNVELTAAMADGWLPLHFWPERAHEIWGAALAAGGDARAPELAPLEVVAGGPLAIGDEVEELRERARPMLALYFGGMGAKGRNYYNDVLRRYGYEKEAEAIQDAYLAGRKREAAAMIPADLVEAMSLVGPAGFVKERVAAYREAGVTVLNVQAIGPNRIDDIETVGAWL